MKTRIVKIFIVAMALIFAGAGVSFAHDSRGSRPKPREDVHGYYEQGHHYHPGRHHHPKPKYKFHERHRHRNHHEYHYHHRRDRHGSHKGSVVGFKVNEPGLKVVVVVKDRR